MACPRCGTVYQFRRGPEKTGKPSKPGGPGRAAEPAAVPVVPVDELVEPFIMSPATPFTDFRDPGTGAEGDSPFDLATELPAAGRVRRRRRAKSGWLTVGLWAVLLGSVVCSCVLVFQLLGGRQASKKGDTTDWVPEEAKFNFRLRVDQGEWKENAAARLGLRAFFTLEKTASPFWLAVAAEDFGTRNPRDAELEKGAVNRLENFFTDSGLEWEPRLPVERLAGRLPGRIVFQGERDKVLVRGECCTFGYRGIGYWIFLWAPANQNKNWQKTRGELAALLHSEDRGFMLLEGRRGWEERPPQQDTFKGSKRPFALRGLKGLWEEFPATDEDPLGELYLQRQSAREAKDPVRGVTVLVLVIPKKAASWRSAVDEAKDHLAKRQPVVDQKPKLKLAPGQTHMLGVKKQIGNVLGRVVELKIINGNLENFAVMAVVRRARHVLVIQCQCPWKDRTSWRGEFNQMLETFDLNDEG